MAFAGFGVVLWSDGSVSKGWIPVPTTYVGLGPLLKVGWSDGGTSWYLGRSARTDAEYRQEQVVRCVEALRGDPTESRRDFAATWMALNADLIEPDSVVPVLAVAANDPSPEVRLSIVAALHGFIERSPSAAPALVDVLKDEQSVVRVAAARALADTRPETDQAQEIVIPALVRALNDKSGAVRCRAARSLVALRGGGESDPAVIEALKSCVQ
jgi:HEAT repeat protein